MPVSDFIQMQIQKIFTNIKEQKIILNLIMASENKSQANLKKIIDQKLLEFLQYNDKNANKKTGIDKNEK